MRTNPHDIVSLVIINRLHIIVRNAVFPFLVAIPTVRVVFAVVDIHATPFGTNPQVAVLIFRHSSDDGAAQTFFFGVTHLVAGIDFIFRIEVIDSAEISPQPKRSLSVFDNTPDRRVGESVRFTGVGSIELEITCTFLITVQAVESTYP